MAMGKREGSQQQQIFVDADGLRSPGHPFYRRLNAVLAEHGFDDFVEQLCQKFYDPKQGRPSIAPGVYLRMLLIGYFEGIDSERGIAWRGADSLALREFLGFALDESPADHSSVSRTRRRLDLETHNEVFQWILGVLAKEDLVDGKTIGVDATTLEANAALRSIVRRDTGDSYEEYLNTLANASGIETPTRKDRAKIDKKRPKKGSNQDWEHPKDPDARITKMKDGRTHLAHKLEHAVDMSTGAVVAVTVQEATKGDSQTLEHTLEEAQENLDELPEDGQQKTDLLTEIVLDRGYHSNATMTYLRDAGIRSYAAEPDRGRAAGRITAKLNCPATRIAVESKVPVASRCNESGASCWNAPSLTVWRQEHCAVSTCDTVTTSSKECSSTSSPSISASSCARKSAVGPRGDSRFLWLVSPFSSALFSTASWVISLSAGRAWAPPTGL